jgi:hypothetical protein
MRAPTAREAHALHQGPEPLPRKVLATLILVDTVIAAAWLATYFYALGEALPA